MNTIEKHGLMDQIRNRGAVKAQIHFSGGNDEGGADSIELLDSKDKKIGTIDPYGRWDPTERKMVYDKPDDQTLGEALTKPIYDKWYSFAGEFQVYGTLTWDTATGEVTMDYNESVESYDHHVENY